jgi:hypothetical protein
MTSNSIVVRSGPYAGRTVELKRRDVANHMWYVSDNETKEWLLVHENEFERGSIASCRRSSPPPATESSMTLLKRRAGR